MMKHRIFRIVIFALLFSIISMAEARAAYYISKVTAHVVQRTGTSVYGGTVMVHDYYGDQSYGITSTESDITYSSGGNVNMVLNAKADDGYKFSGWFINESDANPESSNNSYTKQYAASTSNKGTNSYDIYAKFSPIQYTISFAANGGSGTGPADISYNIESTDKVFPACPYTRAGYEFSGWKPDADVGNWKITDSYSASQTISQKWGDVTLKAQWTPIDYTITYNADGGTLSPSGGSQTYNIESTGTVKSATKTDYSFKGWQVTTTGGNWPAAGSTVSDGASLTGKYGNVALKALWAPLKADVTISVSGLAEGETIMFTVKKDNATLYTVPVTGKASGSVSVTIKDLPTGSGYSVAPVQGWNFAYDGLNQQDTFGLGASGQTSSFTLTKKSSAKKYDEKSEVNWKP